MEAPETFEDGLDAIGRRKRGRAGYRGLMVAKHQPLPARRRLCSGLSAAY